MKKHIIWVILCLLLIFVCGCAENPKDDAVVNKNEGVLESAIENKDDFTREQDVPETYQDTFENDAGDVKVSVSASVKPVAGELPVVRVEPHEISTEEVKHWADVLFEGNTAYDAAERMSKTEIEQQILEYKKRISNKDVLMEEYGNEDDVQQYIAYLEGLIENLERQYKEAPEASEKEPCDWKFHAADYYVDEDLKGENDEQTESMKKTKEIQAITNLNGFRVMLNATNRNEKDFMTHMLWFYYDYEKNEEFDLEGTPYVPMKEEEAISLSDNLIKKLNLKNWTLSTLYNRSTPEKSIFEFCYTPSYEGIPEAETMGIDLRSDDMYAANFYYSKLEISIINGIVEKVLLTSPMNVKKIENDNVKTLPFDEIYQSFQNYAKQKFTASYMEAAGSSGGVVITEIEQKMFRVKEKNNDGEFLMVPAWIFSAPFSNENGAMQHWVIVNAVDGSIINENLGY